MRITGIYKIQSIIKPERFYIGSAIDVRKRWTTHKNDLRHNRHHSPMLQRHFNKYGFADLVFIIIEPCLPEFLTIREDTYIKPIKPYFNVCENAGSTLGFKYSKEQIEKIKEARKGYRPSEETKKRISKSLIGNKRSLGCHPSEETRKKLSEKLSGENNPRFGVKLSEETKKKISLSHIGKDPWNKGKITGQNSWLGKKHSEEAKRKMSEKAKGRKFSEETLKKRSLSLKGKNLGPKNPMYGVHRTGKDAPMYGKKHSLETRERMRQSRAFTSDELRRKRSEAGKLRKHTEEEKRKISESNKRTWILRRKNKAA